MSNLEKIPYPTEANLDRLVIDKETEQPALGRKLGQLVWRNIALANLDATMHFGGRADTPDKKGDEDIAVWKEHKISRRRGAGINFAVPADYEGLFGTPDWLLLAKRIDLRVYDYDIDLPEDVAQSDIPDSIGEYLICISLADESQYDASTQERRRESYVARSEDGSALDAQDTATVIGILTLMADKAEGI